MPFIILSIAALFSAMKGASAGYWEAVEAALAAPSSARVAGSESSAYEIAKAATNNVRARRKAWSDKLVSSCVIPTDRRRPNCNISCRTDEVYVNLRRAAYRAYSRNRRFADCAYCPGLSWPPQPSGAGAGSTHRGRAPDGFRSTFAAAMLKDLLDFPSSKPQIVKPA